jgi:predicted aspartyl protease
MGHISKDCPSTCAFIASPDGDGYVSTSDVEDDDIFAANTAAGSDTSKVNAINSEDASASFPSLLVQRVLSAQEQHEDDTKAQRNNLFHMFLVVQERRVLTIIDTGSCNNLVSSDLIRKLGLETRPLHFPYNIEWFNNSGKAKVTHSARIHFSVGSYHDYVDFDVVCFY